MLFSSQHVTAVMSILLIPLAANSLKEMCSNEALLLLLGGQPYSSSPTIPLRTTSALTGWQVNLVRFPLCTIWSFHRNSRMESFMCKSIGKFIEWKERCWGGDAMAYSLKLLRQQLYLLWTMDSQCQQQSHQRWPPSLFQDGVLLDA